MKVKVYNLEGQEAGELELEEDIFNIPVKSSVVQEVYEALQSNRREPWADSKTRGEVRGGGKKPWAQKGTGRARQGSIRSPIWKGGGVVFGPLSSRNYKKKINKKKNRLATKMCLTDKAKSEALWVVEGWAFTAPKTKLFINLLKKLPSKQKTFLVLTPEKDDKIMRMTRNLSYVKTERAADVNVAGLLSKEAVLTTREGIAKLAARFRNAGRRIK